MCAASAISESIPDINKWAAEIFYGARFVKAAATDVGTGRSL